MSVLGSHRGDLPQTGVRRGVAGGRLTEREGKRQEEKERGAGRAVGALAENKTLVGCHSLLVGEGGGKGNLVTIGPLLCH